MIHAVADPLALVVIATFLAAMSAEYVGRRQLAVKLAIGAWVGFGAFWFTMFPYFYFDFQSPLESILSLVAVPLCLYTGYLLATGHRSLLRLSRAVGLMGLIYLPFLLYDPAARLLIETVAIQTTWGMEFLGYSPEIETGVNGYESRFDMEPYTGERYSTYVVLACTGIGSIAIFGGLIAATSASLKRKLAGIGVAVGIIWVLNLARNVFIGLAAPLGWFDYPILETITVTLAGPSMRTSFFVSHHLIAQSLAVVALIGIALIVMRIVPEIMAILEDALFVVTGSRYDLQAAIGQSTTSTDGGRSTDASDSR